MIFRKYPVVLQHDQSDCAAAVLATICKNYNQERSIMQLRDIIGTDAYGTTVQGLVAGAEKLGFSVKAVRVEIKALDVTFTLPAIAHVTTKEGYNHFVVINKIKNQTYFISDPAQGRRKLSQLEFEEIFSGVLIVLVPKNDFEIRREKKMSMWALFKQIMLPQKKMLITVIICSAILTLLGIVSSLFSKAIFDEVIPYQLKNTLFVYLGVFLVIGFIQIFLSFFRSYVLLYFSRKVDIPILLGYYNHILRLPYNFFQTRHVGDILTRFRDAMTIKDIFSNVSVSLVLDTTLAIFTGIALFNINAPLFSITVIVVVIDAILIYAFKGRYKTLNYDQMAAEALMNSQMIDSIKNIETVKAFANEAKQIDKLENRFVSLLQLDYNQGILGNVQNVISSGVGNISNIVMIGLGALAIINGKMTIGDLMVFQTLSGYFTSPIQNLVSLQLTYQEAQIAMTRLSELMDLDTEEMKETHKLEEIELKGEIQFENVAFRYGSRAPVISGLDLTVKKGERLAIVGESGAGKSTISKILMKFYEIESGKVMMNGYDLRDVGNHYLRNRIGYVPQNIELFTGSIYDNICFGDDSVSYEQVLAAAKIADCLDFINKLPNRFQTIVEENGMNFSGGERQRIAIARAFLKERDLYIFDESTSNLDSFSELSVQKAMLKKTNGATTIIIAHRLSTIRNADRIVFLNAGKIIEQGTHDELVSLKGNYAQMVNLQFGSFSKKQTGNKKIIIKGNKFENEITY
ncbi:peptidase domain-containing ABC transporter [Lactococcus cremoris]|uniref:peptidase domain-containing ABC transporter n=1 Tax=Lactococcus lactis subsp. cremoris TaxID=1359 RepID=UPI0003AB540E|nr:peptidase domain-containing ABC transporter [Lactococcus cremoris]AGV72780.1 bacteriocin system ABC transporter peptidase/permease/ATP-binding protein [Lactococcus cremoris subsp. cremoris KW2]